MPPGATISRSSIRSLRPSPAAPSTSTKVYAELARILETKTTAEWTAILEKADVPVMPMHDLESLLGDPHIVATDFFPVVIIRPRAGSAT